jgi:GDP-4-dehydro-6-deoxy-D-mannose reductase
MSSASIGVELDRARLRPSDNPIIAGDRSRIGAEAHWAPEIPIERTLGDLLAYWRDKTRRATGG